MFRRNGIYRWQGTWMGALTAGGCVSRTVSPILVSLLYQQYGPRPTFGFMFGISLSIIVLILCTYRRLIPYQYETKPEPNKYWKRSYKFVKPKEDCA